MAEKMEYAKFDQVTIRSQGKKEQWLEDIIVDDPTLLGFGDLGLIERQRAQPTGGRLDLLLRDDGDLRYVVELQLGTVDPSHIIRTIEYWDTERKRYPQYDHVAVIVAEDITSRFLNVISLFNGVIPLVAIQVNAFRVGKNNKKIGLNFVRVLDQMSLGMLEENVEVVDRAFWEKKRPQTLKVADKLLEEAKRHNASLESLKLNYTRHYIGPKVGGKNSVFFKIWPKANSSRLEIKLDEQDDTAKQLLDKMYPGWGSLEGYGVLYSVRLEDIKKHHEGLSELIRKAYAQFMGEDA